MGLPLRFARLQSQTNDRPVLFFHLLRMASAHCCQGAHKFYETTKRVAMNITRVGSQRSAKGSPEYFAGDVRIDPLFEAPDPARVHGASVTFQPGARTVAHASVRPDLDYHVRRRRVQRWEGAVKKSIQATLSGFWMEHVADQ